MKYSTKKGYLDDKFGLPGNLWAVRIKDRQSKDFAFGKFLFLNDACISSSFNLLCVGDSMIIFLLSRNSFKNLMVHAFTICGALISQVKHHIERLANLYTPWVVFIHAGINNLSKDYLFESENEQLYAATKQLDALTVMLQHLCSRERNVTVIFSLIVKCKDEFINAKSRIMNDRTTNVCKQNGWLVMDNSNISYHHLMDVVHLNGDGESVFSGELL